MKARTNFDLQGTLHTDKELAAFTTPSEAIDFMKSRLLLAGVSTNLWKDSAKMPSYRDITSATDRHTSSLSASLANTANSPFVKHATKPGLERHSLKRVSSTKMIPQILR
jgi:hypothetical protein